MDAQTIAYAKRYRRLLALLWGFSAAGFSMIINGVGVIFSGQGNLLLDAIAPGVGEALVIPAVLILVLAGFPVNPVRHEPESPRRLLIYFGLGMVAMGILAGLWINRPWSEHPLPESVRLPATLTAVVAAALWIGLLGSVYEWVLATKLHPPPPPGENSTSVAPGIPPHL